MLLLPLAFLLASVGEADGLADGLADDAGSVATGTGVGSPAGVAIGVGTRTGVRSHWNWGGIARTKVRVVAGQAANNGVLDPRVS